MTNLRETSAEIIYAAIIADKVFHDEILKVMAQARLDGKGLTLNIIVRDFIRDNISKMEFVDNTIPALTLMIGSLWSQYILPNVNWMWLVQKLDPVERQFRMSRGDIFAIIDKKHESTRRAKPTVAGDLFEVDCTTVAPKKSDAPVIAIDPTLKLETPRERRLREEKEQAAAKPPTPEPTYETPKYTGPVPKSLSPKRRGRPPNPNKQPKIYKNGMDPITGKGKPGRPASTKPPKVFKNGTDPVTGKGKPGRPRKDNVSLDTL